MNTFSGEYLKDIILKTLNKYKVRPGQIYTITSDNGANIIKAVKLIEMLTLPEPDIDEQNRLDLDKPFDENLSDFNTGNDSSTDSETDDG